MVGGTKESYFGDEDVLGELSLRRVVVLDDELVGAISDSRLAHQDVFGGSGGHCEVINETAALHIHPLCELVLTQADEVVLRSVVRHQVALVQLWSTTCTIHQINCIYMEAFLPLKMCVITSPHGWASDADGTRYPPIV